MTFKYLIRRRLKDYGMTIKQLGAEMDVGPDIIGYMLNHDVKPLLEYRRKLCRILDLSPDVLDAAIRETLKRKGGG